MPWFSKKQQPVAVVEQVTERKKVVTGPRLAVLQPDIAGISSFRLSVQDDADDAEALIAGLRADVRRGTHAFWAMHDRPQVDEESIHVETLVLIRAKAETDLVYVVSFLDLESALSFTRFEVRRGLYIGNVMIYWAAFTQIREELEGVSVLPRVAPPSVHEPWPGPDVRIAQTLPPQPQPEPQATAAAEPQPQVESIAELEARKAVERYLEKNPEKAAEPDASQPPAIEEPVAAIEQESDEGPLWPSVIESAPIFEPEAVSEEAAIADALVLQHPPVAAPIVEEPPEVLTPEPEPDVIAQRRDIPFVPKRRWSARERREQAELVAEEQPQVAAELSVEALAERRQTLEAPELIAEEPIEVTFETPAAAPGEPFGAATGRGELAADFPEIAAGGPIETFAGDEEAEAEPAVLEIEAKSPAVDPAAGMPQAEKYNEFDIALEVERLLKNRKWESREGPFRGFKSPPGRF